MPWGRVFSRIPPSQRRPLALLAVVFCVVSFLFALNLVALKIESGARAYATGNSLWAAAQKDAVFHLERYADTGNSADWEAFRKRLAIPLGDRRARLALDQSPPDLVAADAGLRAADNNPADISMLIRLYRYFSWEPHFAHALDAWRKADQYILELQSIGDQIHAEVSSTSPDSVRMQQFISQAHAANIALRPLEERFATALGDAGRWITQVLLVAMLAVSFLVFALGAYLVRRVTAASFESEARLRATFEHAALGIAHVGLDGRWLSMNDRMAEILGQPREMLVDQPFANFTHPEDREPSKEAMRRLASGEEDALQLRKRYLRADGSTVWTNVNSTLLRDIHDRPLYYITIVEDVTEQHRLAEKLTHQARHDALTGLINRAEFENRLQAAIETTRIDDDHGGLCFLDLDQFKVVNDTWGHLAGDALLQQVANLIRMNVRNNDTLGRLGGDEFGLLLQACPPEAALAVAEKIRTALEEFQFTWEGDSYRVSVSVGVAMFDAKTEDVDQLFAAADAACYAAKAAGRNAVRLAGRERNVMPRQHTLRQRAADVRSALEEERLLLAWQPIVPVARVSAPWKRFEVLLRMRTEDGDILPPARFLPTAERHGLNRQLDRWVLRSALMQLASAPESISGLEMLSVNISSATMSDATAVDELRTLIAESGVEPQLLCLEISETAAISNMAAAVRFLDKVHEIGCITALDDFGSGAVSFRYLDSLPVEQVKFDGLLVRDIDTDPVHETIVRAMNDIAHAMNKKTVAKYAERPPVLARLRKLGVDMVQGHAIGAPELFADLVSGASELAAGKKDEFSAN